MTSNAIDRHPVSLLPTEGLPPSALVVGDPARAEQIAARLDETEKVASNREYVTFRGSWHGTEVLVASHGVGAPGALCLFQEMLDSGVTTFIRVGTAGAMEPSLDRGDLIIAEAAVREDGVTDQHVPVPYPAYSTPEVVLSLTHAAHRHDVQARRGIVWTRALFRPGHVSLNTDAYRASNVIAIEMELAALLVVAATRRARAGGLLVIDGVTADDAPYDPHSTAVAEGTARAAEIALDALRTLAGHGAHD